MTIIEDMMYWGELVPMSVADAMRLYPNKLTKEEWVQVAQSWSGKFGNSTWEIAELLR